MWNREAVQASYQQLHASALTITQIHTCRSQVELFFKWIKQHLRIKAFYGSEAHFTAPSATRLPSDSIPPIN